MAMLKLIAVALGLVCLQSSLTAATVGTYQAPLVPGECDIHLQAYGYIDSEVRKGSFIKVNGVVYLDSFRDNFVFRGLNFVTLDTTTCQASNFAHYDTHQVPASANDVATYLYNLPDGTHILGVSSDSITYTVLAASAVNALRSLGVDASGMRLQDKILFHAVKGQPDITVVRTSKAGGSSLRYDEKAATCNACQSGGTLKLDEETGLYCQCPKTYIDTFCKTTSGQCDISMQAYGYIDAEARKGSYIKINDITYFDSFNDNFAFRGFNFMTLNTQTCEAVSFVHYDTHQVPASANDVANYIYGLPDGTHILGVSSDSVTWSTLGLGAVNALRSLGVDVSGIRLQDKVLFIAVKGQPGKTVVRQSKAGGSSLRYDEKAVTCDTCSNGGILKRMGYETGVYFDCPSNFIEVFCENMSDTCAQ